MPKRLHADTCAQAGADGVRFDKAAKGYVDFMLEGVDRCTSGQVTAAQIAFRSP